MKNIYRIIFWSIILVICIVAGTFGLLESKKSYTLYKDKLSNIVKIFNNNSMVNEYNIKGLNMEAKLDNKKIVVKFNGTETKEYEFNFKENLLETEINYNDSVGKAIVMILTDSISTYYKEEEGNVYEIFNTKQIYNYTIDDGIEYKKVNDKIKVKISLDNYIKETDL